MSGILLLSVRHLAANKGVALILVLCLTITAFVPGATAVLTSRYETSLLARSGATPFVIGAPGSRFDLVLGALYFRPSTIDPVPRRLFDELRHEEGLLAIPMHVEHTAQGEPVVGTNTDYFLWRRLATAHGRLPATMGEAVLGHRAAARLQRATGGTVFTDQPDLYDIAKPPSIELKIVGVLAPSGTPDDDAVFVDIKTTWLMSGYFHGHQEAASIDNEDLLIGRSDTHVAVSGALIEDNQVNPANVERFHVHGDPALLPLTAIIIDPDTTKVGTMTKARINTGTTGQMVEPRTIIDELLRFVFRIKSLLDALSIALAVCTAGLGALVIALSLRLRRDEIDILNRMGCGRHTVKLLCGGEVGIMIITGAALAAALVAATATLAPDLVSYL